MAASRILVGYDAGPHAEDALALARTIAGCSGADIVLGRVVAQEPLDLTAVPLSELRADLEERERLALEELQGVADRHGVLAATGAGSSPARGLSDLADELEPELVVVGSSHRGRLGQVLAGNVAVNLLNGLDRPLAVAPAGYSEHPARLATIGVGFDGTPEAREALRAAARLARGCGAQIEVIRVLSPIPGLMPSPWAIAWGVGALEGAEEHARERIEAALRSLPDEAPGTSRVETGAPPVVLADASDQLDLLVIGSRGYGPTRRVLLGSVSARLVREARCPVLVTPRPPSGDRENVGVVAARA